MDKTKGWMGSDDWWNIVMTSPMDDALTHLHMYRSMLMRENAGKPTYAGASALLTRVSFEIKRRNRLLTECGLREVARKVLPAETFGFLMEQIRLTEIHGLVNPK